MGGEAAIGSAAADGFTDAASGCPADASAVGWATPTAAGPKPADGGGLLSEARPFGSIGRTSGPMTLPWAGCETSVGGVGPASLEVGTVKLLSGCTVVGRCAVAMSSPAFVGPGSTRSSQKIEPIPAAPARTSAEALNVQAPE